MPDDPLEAEVHSAELDDEEGRPYRVDQENVGPGGELGGGEHPDPDTPPQAPAPGA